VATFLHHCHDWPPEGASVQRALTARFFGIARAEGDRLDGPHAALTISPGTYWVVGEFDEVALICTDNASNDLVVFAPDGGTPLRLDGTVDINFYVAGTLL
jgi:hypothetical protein